MVFGTFDSPLGPISLESNGDFLTRLSMGDGEFAAGTRDDSLPVFVAARAQLSAYFAGELREFFLPLAPNGTEFQTRVWDLLRAIPYGETRSYGQLARELGSPGASRAVGLANGANRLAIVIPCHRVVGSDGSLTGFAYGIERKRRLLAVEGIRAEVPRSRLGQPSLF